MQDLEKLKKIIEKSGDGYYKIKVRNGKIIKIFHEKNLLLEK
uniref:NTF2-2 NTF2 fold immunity protein n=1 Tax=Podoviridae sp. ct8nN1 TaxID=2827296 RepID=A0A8S5R4N7_9CAUD|nr:MAG TPA: NTF2-2 NTF2 fold immunity protein [Podoviridae sp. ct8nN1]